MVNPVAQALQPLQPFIWGRGGAKLTPEQIAREREIAEALGTVDMSPVDHWLQGAARMANAAVGRLRESRADRAERENAEATKGRLAEMAKLLGGVGGSTAMTPALSGASPVAATAPAVSSEPMDYASQRVAQAHAAGSGVLPPSFVAAVDRSEGGGGYDTLFSFANREGPFAGVDVSQMSIGDVMAFTDPSGPYAQFVKGKVGRVATPVGRHQIVGTTLRNAVQELGLDPSQPFDPATQDMIALHLAKKRVQSANTTEGKIAALRSEWEGFKSVPDDQMVQIVADIEAAPVNAAGPVSQRAVQAQLESLPVGGTMTMPTPDQMATGSTQPSPVAMALAPQAAPSPAPVQVAQAGGGINPVILEALSSPYASPGEREIAGLLLQQQMQAQQPQSLINAGGGNLYDPNSGQWIQAPGAGQLDPTSAQQNYQFLISQGVDPQEAMDRAFRSGVTVNMPGQPNIGPIPPGYSAVQDESGNWSMAPIPGGPAALEAEQVVAAGETKDEQAQTWNSIVNQEIGRALDLIENSGLPTTGMIGDWLSGLGGTGARDLRGLLDTIKANAGFDRLQAMRDASPTGGALGQVSERELAFLQSTIGNLEQSQSREQLEFNLRRLQRIYQNMLEGRRAYDGLLDEDGQGSGLPEGVTEEDLRYTMEKHGLTREEVLERLNAR